MPNVYGWRIQQHMKSENIRLRSNLPF